MLKIDRKILSGILIVIMLCSFVVVSAENTEYSLLNTGYVRLLSRGEVVDENSRTFNWPNSGFEFEFSGTEASVYVDKATTTSTDSNLNGSYFNTAVYDGDTLIRVERIKLEEGNNIIYTEKTGDPEVKKIMFVRSSEACRGTVLISSLSCDAVPKATEARIKKLEFIGDSYTAGYGNSPALSERNIYCAKNTDSWNSYTGIVARNYNADNTVIAYQGKGVYANRNLAKLDYTMSRQFELEEIYVDEAPSMNFSTGEEHIFYNYQPNIVTIWLGTNDEAAPVDTDTFGVAYNKLLEKVRSKYPDAAILCMALEDSMYLDTISKIVADTDKGEANKYYMLVLNSFTSINLGHPDIAEDNRIAQQIIEKIDSIEGVWTTPVYNEEKKENVSLRVDYNTGRVSAYGKTNKNDNISMVVMKPMATTIDTNKKEEIAFIGQAKANKAGEFGFEFKVERLAGEYTFCMNSMATESLKQNEFTIKNIIPVMSVTSNGRVVKTMADLDESRKLTAQLSGFKFDEVGFKGVLAIVSYQNGVMTAVDFADASENSQNLGSEVTKTVTIDENTDSVKVLYLNSANLSPIFGTYSISE